MHHIRISDTAPSYYEAASGGPHTPNYYSRTLFEASFDAIVITDTRGIITDVNHRMVDMTGCVRSDLIGSSWFYFCPDPVTASAAFRRALTKDRALDVPLVVESCSGAETPVTYNAAAVYDAQTNVVGVFATLRDASELRHLKLALDAKNMEVDRANQITSEFFGTMSHALRTPLTAILGFSEALLCGHLGDIGDRQKGYVQNIHDSGQQLWELISGILDLAKIDADLTHVHLETDDLCDLLSHSIMTQKINAS